VAYTDLLRVAVFLSAGQATALGAIAALALGPDGSAEELLLTAVAWLAAVALGLYFGRPSQAADGVRDALARARTATSLPPQSPARVALVRLWPIGAGAVAAGVLGIFFPGVAVAGAAAGIFGALSWHSHEGAVLAIEQRDGVKFYVVPNFALRPVELVRSPGLRSDRLGGATP
jgi:hypothetical protein